MAQPQGGGGGPVKPLPEKPPKKSAATQSATLRIPALAEREGIKTPHNEPLDSYTLPGPVLPFVHIDLLNTEVQRLNATIGDRITDLDLFRREARSHLENPLFRFNSLLAISTDASQVELYDNRESSSGILGLHAFVARRTVQRRDPKNVRQLHLANLPVDTRRIIVRRAISEKMWSGTEPLWFDLALEFDRQPLLVVSPGWTYLMVRLGSGLGDRLSRQLFEEGLPGLLSTKFQEDSVEPPLSVQPIGYNLVVPWNWPAPVRGRLDVDGPIAVYLRELWLELPYLIAGHLNAQQRFAAAQRWYHYLFDPTSDGTAGNPDRVWRYRGFRGATKPSLREALTSGTALKAYQSDPFNPHAIARLRPGAHQKAIVMKYLDNLMDWGDALFAEFTRESLNEATMLYVLAADILGPRPPDVGDCGDKTMQPRTYAQIEEKLRKSSDFLIELELLAPTTHEDGAGSVTDHRAVTDRMLLSEESNNIGTANPEVQPTGVVEELATARASVGEAEESAAPARGSLWRQAGGTPVLPASQRALNGAGPSIRGKGEEPRISATGNPVNPPIEAMRGEGTALKPFGDKTLIPFDYRPHEGLQKVFRPTFDRLDRRPHTAWVAPVLELAAQAAQTVPLFCIPPNRELLAYWDRINDRLNKIRNCMDITGARREPSLFAPEIDPLMMARARAAGLSIEEVLSLGSGSIPPYRFTFLIEKARQYAQSVQGFGNALLSALQNKDAEELARLRNIHERNLLRLRTRMMEWEVTAAEETTSALQRQRDGAEYRRGYYATLHANPLSGAEQVQQIARHTASVGHIAATGVSYLAALAKFLPNLGSPFAITYGGIQLGGAASAVATALTATATVAEAVSASAGIEATFERRTEEWQHQQKLAENELLNLDRQIAASQIRADIARRSLEIHERSVEQAEEVLDLQDTKFTSLGRYTLLATRLHRLHREAFNTALGVARMTEQAFRYERGDDSSVTLAGGYWEASNAGLGAGDALLVDLQRLEQRHLETNLRLLEVEQSFSVAALDPRALLTLRETGTCAFKIPEMAFDLAYPGQYRRRIKAVRVSIPCVTGPHMNVSATLRLTRSQVRRQPRLTDGLTEVPLRHTTAIALSSAQADGGVFEFTFRDERFLPFEGAGAISEWELELPANFRAFDYHTISDVIVRIGYTAEEDAALRAEVEKVTSDVAGSLRSRLENDGLPLVLSLRHDTPDAWHKLVDAATGTLVTVNLEGRHLPWVLVDWLSGRGLPAATKPRLSVSAATVALVTQGISARARPTATMSASFGSNPLTALDFGSAAGPLGLYQASLAGTAILDFTSRNVPITLRLDTSENLAPDTATASSRAIDEEKLRDVVVLLTIKLTTAT
jgi:hypothetical protein